MNWIIDISDVQRMWNDGKIEWSVHASKRLIQKGISRKDIDSAIRCGEIIEEYPSNYPNPACLVFGHTVDGKVIHIVIGIDDRLHIITVYYPDETRFESDLKTRRS